MESDEELPNFFVISVDHKLHKGDKANSQRNIDGHPVAHCLLRNFIVPSLAAFILPTITVHRTDGHI